jgi:hypothetical protein
MDVEGARYVLTVDDGIDPLNPGGMGFPMHHGESDVLRAITDNLAELEPGETLRITRMEEA